MTGGTRNRRQVGKLALGIDIGSKDTKIVVAEQSAQQVDILGAASLSIPSDWVVNGQIVQPKAFAKVVATELASMDHRPTSAVISIPSALATLRWITLPIMDPAERREAARFKVKRHLPFPVEDAYIDTSEPIPTGDGSTGQSLVIAVRREVIDSRAVAIEYAGLQPVGAELEEVVRHDPARAVEPEGRDLAWRERAAEHLVRQAVGGGDVVRADLDVADGAAVVVGRLHGPLVLVQQRDRRNQVQELHVVAPQAVYAEQDEVGFSLSHIERGCISVAVVRCIS